MSERWKICLWPGCPNDWVKTRPELYGTAVETGPHKYRTFCVYHAPDFYDVCSSGYESGLKNTELLKQLKAAKDEELGRTEA